VFLGDTNLVNMMPITPPVFSQSDVYLRVWFSDGVGAYTQLAPDQRLGSVGYAMTAAQLAGPVASANGGPTVFNAGGTEAMRITTTGNVGIGVTNPASKLTVMGQTRLQPPVPIFEGFEGSIFPPAGWTTGGDGSWVRSSAGAYSGSSAATVVASNGNQTIFLDVDFTFPSSGYLRFYWKASGNGFLGLCVDNDACPGPLYYTQNPNWTELVLPVAAGPHSFHWSLYSYGGPAITGGVDHVSFEPQGSLVSEGVAEFQNNVGIGTNNPQQLLHLNVTAGHGEGMEIDSAIAGHSPAIYLNHTGSGGHNYRIASFGDNVNDGSFRIRDDSVGEDLITLNSSRLDVGGRGIFSLYNRGFSRFLNAGLASEDSTRLIDFGINDGSLNRFGGGYNSTYQGGFLRVDGRTDQPLFGFFGRPASTNGEVLAAQERCALRFRRDRSFHWVAAAPLRWMRRAS